MIKQVFKTSCDNCGGEAIAYVVDATGENEVIIDFLDDMYLNCAACGASTGISIDKHLEASE